MPPPRIAALCFPDRGLCVTGAGAGVLTPPAGKAADQTGVMALKLDAKQRFDALVGGPAGMNMFQVR